MSFRTLCHFILLLEIVGVTVYAAQNAPAASTPAAGTTAQSPAPAPPAPDTSVPTSLGSRLKFYGWLRADIDIDSQRPNNGEAILYILPADPAGGSDHGLFSLHPRLTRLGADFKGPDVESLNRASLTGKFESDFENGGTESRQIIRIRHAYLQLGWRSFSILAGQTWDIVSPLYPTVNNDTLMWDAGNIGDRRPQVRADWEAKNGGGVWSLIGGVGVTSAVDASDLDSNGYLDGQESGRPNVQGRVGYSHPIFDQQASLGGSAFYGWMNTSKPVDGRTSWTVQATNIDYTLPLAPMVSLRGEGWWGHNMSDIRGGAGQGVNPVTGAEIRGRGGWSEVSVKPWRYWSFHPGFTIDSPVPADIPIGGRTRNASFYFGNRLLLSSVLTAGADYIRWKTNYNGAIPGLDNRVNVFMFYSF